VHHIGSCRLASPGAAQALVQDAIGHTPLGTAQTAVEQTRPGETQAAAGQTLRDSTESRRTDTSRDSTDCCRKDTFKGSTGYCRRVAEAVVEKTRTKAALAVCCRSDILNIALAKSRNCRKSDQGLNLSDIRITKNCRSSALESAGFHPSYEVQF
jgi:hypothetical protein